MSSTAAMVAVAVIALAGCGGGAAESGATKSGAANGVDYSSAQSIAAALDAGGFGCTGWTPNPAAIGTKESGSCAHGGTNVTVSTFTSAAKMESLLESAKNAFGGKVSGPSVQGPAWLVALDDEAQAPAVQKILGGSIK